MITKYLNITFEMKVYNIIVTLKRSVIDKKKNTKIHILW